ncbi:cation:proton antiporter [Cereibacter sphaeroides]|uniref:cation:proton antiporter n=1 Tax=Cereibacter sphaeroides TaxID=1063 RepID=UPI001F3EA518|nr:cation:proton antiporter [Cereibacter sphaeroides]MCE6959719.1 cation:proton antiporter [Cereibacter sphaeroides]MCE6974420.1 cation:proton antiporter [Cereibacter sphaeroides]
MDIVTLVGITGCLLLLVGFAEPLALRLRLPFPVALALLGALLGLLAHGADRLSVLLHVDPETLEVLELPLRSDLFLTLFLPVLVFQASLHLDLRRLVEDWVPILVLSVVAVVATTLTVGAVIAPLSDMPLMACFLLGAIVSTTDPSAVAAIFRTLPAPRRLARIVEGESLLNDAAAIALVGFFIAFVRIGDSEPGLADAILRFPMLLLGGAAVGFIAARLVLAAMAPLPGLPMAQASLMLALPFLAGLVAEKILHVSGVTAVVVAGLTFGTTGPGRLPPASWTKIRDTWDLLAHWAGALIFVLAALMIPRFLAGASLSDAALVLAVAVAALAARALMLFLVLPALARMRASPDISPAYLSAMLWGGLRGAITLALALSVTESALVPVPVKREIGILAAGFTLFTLLGQGTTLRRIIRRLGLDRLSAGDVALSHQVIAVALQDVREAVSESVRAHDLPPETIRAEAKRFGTRLEAAVRAAEEIDRLPERERITMGLVSLASRERDLVLEEIAEDGMSRRIAERMILDADRLIERTRQSGRDGYRASRERTDRLERLFLTLRDRLGIDGPLARLISDRYEILTVRGRVLRRLHAHVEGRIRRIHSRRVAELLHELIRRREEAVRTGLEALRLQYPATVEALDRRFIRRMALRLEEREYSALRREGLIGQELHMNLEDGIRDEEKRLGACAALHPGLDRRSLLASHPVFADLDEAGRQRVLAGARTRSVHPGEILLSRGEESGCVWLVASGAIEIETPLSTYMVGPGEMFGHLALLSAAPRSFQAVSAAHGTLIQIDGGVFRSLVSEHPGLRERIRAAARLRGVEMPDLARAERARLR